MRSILALLAMVGSISSSTPLLAAPASDASVYPLGICIVSGEKLGEHGDVVTLDMETRQVQFCCKSCVKDFKADPDTYLEKLDAALVENQTATYPLETCPVSGESLGGDMGDPVIQMVGNRMVKLCCKMCKKGLAEDPEKYLAVLDAAVIKAQMEDYPSTQCPVSGKELGSMGDPVDQVIGGRLVRLCCLGCIKSSNEHVAATLERVYGKPEGKAQHTDDHSGHNHE